MVLKKNREKDSKKREEVGALEKFRKIMLKERKYLL